MPRPWTFHHRLGRHIIICIYDSSTIMYVIISNNIVPSLLYIYPPAFASPLNPFINIPHPGRTPPPSRDRSHPTTYRLVNTIFSTSSKPTQNLTRAMGINLIIPLFALLPPPLPRHHGAGFETEVHAAHTDDCDDWDGRGASVRAVSDLRESLSV